MQCLSKGSVLSTAYNSHGFAKMYTFYDAGGNLIGILGDMLNSLSSRLNFKMNATGIPVSDYGTKLQNGSFTGFVGMLQRREFDIVAADTTITAQVREQTNYLSEFGIDNYNCTFFQRSEVVEFSFPFQSAFYQILIERPGNGINWVTYTKGYIDFVKMIPF